MFQAILKYWPLLLGLIAGLILVPFNILGFNFNYMPGDLGDGRFNNYILEHNFQYLIGNIESYWNAPFMFPVKQVICYSDNLMGSSPFYIIFRFLHFDREFSYQAWLLVICILNYLSCYIFLWEWTKNKYAAVLGAFIFAFSIALQSQVTHTQVFPRFCIPLSFLMLLLFIKEFHVKYFFGLLLFCVWQFYCAIYIGLLLSIPLIISTFIVFIKYNKKLLELFHNSRWRNQMLFSLLANFTMLFLLMYPYINSVEKTSELINYQTVINSVPTISSHFFSQPGSLFWDFLSSHLKELPAYWDHQIFAGAIASVSLMIFFCTFYIPHYFKALNLAELRIFAITGMLCFLLFLRIGNYSLYYFIYLIPGFSAMKSLTRVINVELLFFGIAVSYSFIMLTRLKQIKQSILFLSVFGLIILDNFFKTDSVYKIEKAETQSRTNALINKLEGIPPNEIVSYEPEELHSASIHYNLDAMLACQQKQLKCVNAYTGNSPHFYSSFWHEPNTKNRLYFFSKMNFTPEKVYIVKDLQAFLIENTKAIMKSSDSFSKPTIIDSMAISKMVDKIKLDPGWFEHVKKKAKEKNISLDSMLTLDAIWVLTNENK
ncbi:MAG: hypothetical protein IPO78_15035 [Saprospiraceae bacterium]|nr:hypothetical protein [Saprospiraceae bacterium]